MRKLKPLELKKPVERGQAEVIMYRFKQCGWAIVMIQEETGTISIHSDYGDWSYSWPKWSRGTSTLRDFLKQGDYDYLARKFCKNLREEYDGEKTLKGIKHYLIERRRGYAERIHGGGTDKTKARELWDELKRLDHTDAHEFMNKMSEEMNEFLGHNSYEYMETSMPHEFLCLREELLPAIIKEL